MVVNDIACYMNVSVLFYNDMAAKMAGTTAMALAAGAKYAV